jgi:hypothetical protein
VAVTTPSQGVGRLPLCPDCHAICHLPLARHAVDPTAPVRLLVVEPEAIANHVG